MPTIFGDSDDLTGKANGERQVLALGDGVGGTAYGDATRYLRDKAHGGNDTVAGGDHAASNHIYGDASGLWAPIHSGVARPSLNPAAEPTPPERFGFPASPSILRGMKHVTRSIALCSVLAHLLAACTSGVQHPPPVQVKRLSAESAAQVDPATTRAVALRIAVEGDREAALGNKPLAELRLQAMGGDEQYALEIEAGALTVYALPPGRYSVARVGRLVCEGATLDVRPEDDVLLLGTLTVATVEDKDVKSALASEPPEDADRALVLDAMKVEPSRLQARAFEIDDPAGCERAGAEAERKVGETVGKILLGTALVVVLLPLAVLVGGDFHYKHK